ncbi:hypothetical protein Tco_0672094 [Tanacetum coccineum]
MDQDSAHIEAALKVPMLKPATERPMNQEESKGSSSSTKHSNSSNSEVSTDSNCSSSCLENVKILKEQNEQLLKDLRTSKLNDIAYKTEEFVNEPIVSEPTVKKHVVETSKAKASADKPKVVRKNFGPPLIEDWITDSEDEAE